MSTGDSDPIVAEVREVRLRHAARFGFDLAAIFAEIRRRQVVSGREYERRPHRPVAVVESAGTG